MTEHTTQHPATNDQRGRHAIAAANSTADTDDTDIDDLTDEEWELHNLEVACQHLGDAWSAVLRAMYRDTRHVPYQYSLAIREVRRALDTVQTMAQERGGTEL